MQDFSRCQSIRRELPGADTAGGKVRAQEMTPEPYQLYRREEQMSNRQEIPPEWSRLLRDFEYFKSMYPEEAKRLQWFVEEVLDEMEYEGSPIFDEFPDRLLLEQLIRRAAERAVMEEAPMASESEVMQGGMPSQGGMPVQGGMPSQGGMPMQGGLLVQEIHAPFGPVEHEYRSGAENIGIPENGYRMWEAGMLNFQELQQQEMRGRRPQRPPQGPGSQRPPQGPGPQRPPQGPGPWRPPQGPGPWRPPLWPADRWDLLSILLMNELQRRRCRNGRCW